MVKCFRVIPAASLRLLVFDLDGTLIDSRADLCSSVNAMLRHFNRQPLPDAVIASYIGDGVGLLVRRALGDPSDGAFFEAAMAYAQKNGIATVTADLVGHKKPIQSAGNALVSGRQANRMLNIEDDVVCAPARYRGQQIDRLDELGLYAKRARMGGA